MAITLESRSQVSQQNGSGRSPGTSPLSWIKGFAWTCVSVILSLIVLELIFRAAHIGEDQVVTLKPVVGHGLIPGKYVTWRQEGFSQGRINSNGMRDIELPVVKPPNTVRIALFGNSVVEALQVPLEDSMAKLIERKLNALGKDKQVQVLNFAVSGYTNMQDYYRYVTDAARYNPDIVLFFFHPGDNQKNMGMKGSDGMPCPYAKLSQDGSLVTDWSYYDKYMKTSGDETFRATDYLRTHCRVFNVWERVKLSLNSDAAYGALVNGWDRLARKVHGASKDDKVASSDAADGRTELLTSKQEMEETRAAISRPPMHRGLLPLNSPSIPPEQQRIYAEQKMVADQFHAILRADQDRLVVTAGIVTAFNREVRKNGGDLVLVALPATDNATLYFKQIESLTKLGQAQDFTVLNLHPKFPPLAPTGSNDLFFPHNIHFTSKGHALAGKSIADFLSQRFD